MKFFDKKQFSDFVKNGFFTVVFEKKNGETRLMNGRLGVKKYCGSVGSTTSHLPNLVTVFEVNKKQYRNFDLERLIEVRVEGKVFKVNE